MGATRISATRAGGGSRGKTIMKQPAGDDNPATSTAQCVAVLLSRQPCTCKGRRFRFGRNLSGNATFAILAYVLEASLFYEFAPSYASVAARLCIPGRYLKVRTDEKQCWLGVYIICVNKEHFFVPMV
jgi:hypothetical protein